MSENKNTDVAQKAAKGTKKAMNTVKNTAKNLVSAIKKIINFIKLLLKIPFGWIALLVIVIVIAVILLIIIITFLFALSEYEQDIKSGGPGISTTEDYETIIGAIGYGGYDTFIPEEKSKEYLAFEYAVLMDVAEYIYENQDYLTTDVNNGTVYKTSAAFPEGKVNTSYNAENISKEEWQNYVVEAQGGSAPTEEMFSKKSSGESIIGGNRDVVTPRLIYETMVGENENEASLMPYIVIVREDLKLNYFLQGLDNATWNSYKNFEEISGDHLKTFQNYIEPVRYSVDLNRYNINMPNSAYKEDLEEALIKEGQALGVEDPNTFIKADKEDEGYGSEIYYTENETNIVYKIPLKLLIGRYMPKATLLSTWYMLKDSSDYDIDGLMETIKDIYNAACYEETNLDIPSIQITDKIDRETGKITSTTSKNLRAGAKESYKEETINDKEIKYATTNNRTFIYFEQYGLETSRYEKYKAYRATSGDYSPYNEDEANPNPISPAATYLTKERANFIQTLNLELSGIRYIDENGVEQTTDESVNLKPTYSFLEDPDLDEKLKSKYLFGEEIPITQEKPIYSFMGKVVKRAEEIFTENGYNERVYKEDPNRDDGAIIYDHYVINKLYIKAELGNEKQEDLYRLPEDFRYYNQDDQMPHWYDLKGNEEEKDSKNIQEELEKAYLEAFQEVYEDPNYSDDIIAMLRAETGLEVVGYDTNGAKYSSDKNIDYYKLAVYIIEVKQLQMRQTIYHTRMPVLLVKYCDTWAKSIEYSNSVIQNPLNLRNYKYLIPNSTTSLGFQKMELNETAKFRTTMYKDFFNSANGKGNEGIKEADVLNMLIQWEDLGNSRWR